MPSNRPTREDDERALALLSRIENDGLSYSQAGRTQGISRSAVCGLVKRVRDDLALAGPCLCQKPENQDGGMPRRWWQ